MKVAPSGSSKGARGFTSGADKGPSKGFAGGGKAAWPGAIGPDGKLQPMPLAQVDSARRQRLKVEPLAVA